MLILPKHLRRPSTLALPYIWWTPRVTTNFANPLGRFGVCANGCCGCVPVIGATIATEAEIVVSGIVNDICGDCSSLNTTYILPLYTIGDTYIFPYEGGGQQRVGCISWWQLRYPDPPLECGFWLIEIAIAYFTLDDEFEPDTTEIWARFHDGYSGPHWYSTFDGNLSMSDINNLAIDYAYDNSVCDASSSTFTMTLS